MNESIVAKLTTLLRVSIGAGLVAHSVYFQAHLISLNEVAQSYSASGLPTLLAYLVFVAEAIGGMLLIAGLHTRRAAIAMIPVTVVAATMLSGASGGVSYALIFAAALLARFVGVSKASAQRPQLTKCVGDVHSVIKAPDGSDNMPHAA